MTYSTGHVAAAPGESILYFTKTAVTLRDMEGGGRKGGG